MKTQHIAALSLFAFSLSVLGQTIAHRPSAKARTTAIAPPHATPWSIVDKGQHYQTWERTTYELSPSGQWIPCKHKIEERTTGLNFKDSKTGEWIASREQITILPDGTAAATLGNHKAYFPADISGGVIELVGSDGKRLKSRPLGVTYFDGTNNVLIAEITNSIGQLVGNNQIIYTNCFSDFAADLVFTYRRGGFEQDVIFRQQPPSPALWGLNPDDCRLELLTEFFGAPEPSQTPGKKHPRGNLQDTVLSFGAMTMVRGKAFQIGYSQTPGASAAQVYKTWAHLQGRTFLIEELLYSDIATQLQSLPPSVTTVVKAASPNSPLHRLSSVRLLPPPRVAQAGTNVIRVADASSFEKPGVVLDYNAVESQTNLTFQADTTYYVSGSVNLYGVTTIEGNTVIKCDTNTGASINILGTVNCQSAPYRPAVFTSTADNSLGESVPTGTSPTECSGTFTLEVDNNLGLDLDDVYVYDDSMDALVDDSYISSSTLATYYTFSVVSGQHYQFDAFEEGWEEVYIDFWPTLTNGDVNVCGEGCITYSESGAPICTLPPISTGLFLQNGGALHDLRFCNLAEAISSAANYSITNGQFVNCGSALDSEDASLFAGNILLANVGTGFDGGNFTATAQQLTFDQGTSLTGTDTGSSLALVNSILTGVAGNGSASITTNTVAKLSSNSGVYVTVGGGDYYLPTNSPYHAIGTNIDANLAMQLAGKTTWAPIGYTNVTFTNAQTFCCRAIRDTNSVPDLGYHYDPLDYIFGGCNANSNITFNAGIAVGWWRTVSGWTHTGQGIHIGDSQTVAFKGTVTSPDCWARLNTVQEQDYSAGFGPGGLSSWAANLATAGHINASFTRFSMMAADGNHMRDDWGWLVAKAWNCEFYSGGAGGYIISLYLTNCLFDRICLAQVDGNGGCTVDMRNCTMIGNLLQLVPGNVSYYSVRDCAFDGTQFQFSGYAANSSYADYDYNALTNASNPFPFGQSHKVVVTNFNWQSSWLGNYYQTTNSLLIDKGDVTADQVGLYHFTTQTNQIKETNSIVDIGYHYVALDADGNPDDMDGDGVPDYLEDSNGNGAFDGGDLSNWLIGTFNGLSFSNRLQVFTPLK